METKAEHVMMAPVPGVVTMPPSGTPFWSKSAEETCAALRCGQDGLSTAEAIARLASYGANSDAQGKRIGALRAIFRRLLEPLSLILLAASVVSAGTGDIIGGSIIAAILIISIGLDTLQEGHAARAADILRQSVALTAEVRRDGTYLQLPVEKLVPGDLIRVRAGDIIPADGLVIESAAFAANEAALTGEPYPVEKQPGPVAGQSASEATGALFRGAVALTGEAIALMVNTGRSTIFGAAAAALGEVAQPIPLRAGSARIWTTHRPANDGPCRSGAGDERLLWTARSAIAALLRRARGRTNAGTASDDYDGDAVARRNPHGPAQGDREAACRDPRSRRYDCAVHRQDGHTYIGRDYARAQSGLFGHGRSPARPSRIYCGNPER